MNLNDGVVLGTPDIASAFGSDLGVIGRAETAKESQNSGSRREECLPDLA